MFYINKFYLLLEMTFRTTTCTLKGNIGVKCHRNISLTFMRMIIILLVLPALSQFFHSYILRFIIISINSIFFICFSEIH